MLGILSTLAQVSGSYEYDYGTYSSTASSDEAAVAAAGFMGIILLTLLFAAIFYVIISISMFKVFKKAGRQDAWAAFVPLYNNYVMFEVAGRPGWWAFLAFIPIIGGVAVLVTTILGSIDLAKSFGKSGGYAALIVLLPIIGWPMLAFSDATYSGPAGPEGSNKPPVQPTATPQSPSQPAM
jgi:uncharacterized membrane protein YhaH (DUF805 family)